MTLAVVLAVPKSLPPERRHGGGLHTFLVAGRQVLGAPELCRLPGGGRLGDGCPVRLRRHLGIRAAVDERDSPLAYSIDFAANAAGMTVVPDRRPACRPNRDPHSHPRWPARRPRRRCRDADRRHLVRHPADPGDHLLLRHDDRPGPHRTQRRGPRLRRRPRPPRQRIRRPRFRSMGRGRHHRPLAGLGGKHTGVPMASLMIAGAAASMIGLLVIAKPEATPTRAVRDVLD